MDQEGYVLAALQFAGHFPEFFFTIDRLSIDLEDYISRRHLNVIAKGVGFYLSHYHALAFRSAQTLSHFGRDIAYGDSQLASGRRFAFAIVFRVFPASLRNNLGAVNNGHTGPFFLTVTHIGQSDFGSGLG